LGQRRFGPERPSTRRSFRGPGRGPSACRLRSESRRCRSPPRSCRMSGTSVIFACLVVPFWVYRYIPVRRPSMGHQISCLTQRHAYGFRPIPRAPPNGSSARVPTPWACAACGGRAAEAAGAARAAGAAGAAGFQHVGSVPAGIEVAAPGVVAAGAGHS
jgi:hypothetical protein